jgi:hypothetical protein
MPRPTAADAQTILHLYDLRREAEMRKARNWWAVTFWPMSADDVMKIANNFGTQENAWFRQVLGYWEMAASLALSGAVHRDLFAQPSVSGEMYFLFAKIRPFLKDVREKLQSPTFLSNVERLIGSSKQSKDFFRMMEGRIAARRKAMAEGAGKG